MLKAEEEKGFFEIVLGGVYLFSLFFQLQLLLCTRSAAE